MAFFGNLDKITKCSNCGNRMLGEREPKMLACGHIYCKGCIEQISEVDRNNLRLYKIVCPSCRLPYRYAGSPPCLYQMLAVCELVEENVKFWTERECFQCHGKIHMADRHICLSCLKKMVENYEAHKAITVRLVQLGDDFGNKIVNVKRAYNIPDCVHEKSQLNLNTLAQKNTNLGSVSGSKTNGLLASAEALGKLADCIICYSRMDVARPPMVLGCGHIFCTNCVGELGLGHADRNTVRVQLCCPSCRSTQWYSGGPPVVYKMQELCSLIGENLDSLSERVCSECCVIIKAGERHYCMACYQQMIEKYRAFKSVTANLIEVASEHEKKLASIKNNLILPLTSVGYANKSVPSGQGIKSYLEGIGDRFQKMNGMIGCGGRMCTCGTSVICRASVVNGKRRLNRDGDEEKEEEAGRISKKPH